MDLDPTVEVDFFYVERQHNQRLTCGASRVRHVPPLVDPTLHVLNHISYSTGLNFNLLVPHRSPLLLLVHPLNYYCYVDSNYIVTQ